MILNTEEINTLKELNKNIVNKSMAKVKESLELGTWDGESFYTMNDSIENILALMKIQKYTEKEQVQEQVTLKKMNAREEVTEFEDMVYKISDMYDDKESMVELTTVIAEMVEDLKIISPRLYKTFMAKLEGML